MRLLSKRASPVVEREVDSYVVLLQFSGLLLLGGITLFLLTCFQTVEINLVKKSCYIRNFDCGPALDILFKICTLFVVLIVLCIQLHLHRRRRSLRYEEDPMV